MSNHCLHDAPSATYEECFCGKCGEYGDMEKLFEKECPSSKLCHCKMSDTTPKFLESITEHPDVQRLIGQVEILSQENKKLKKFVQRVAGTYATGGDSEYECEMCRGEIQYSAKQILKGE